MRTKESHPMALEIFESIAKSRQDDRGYLGMSLIAEPCARQVWFNWRNCTGAPWDGRILAIFDLGNAIEKEVVKFLRLAGYKLHDAYPDQQIRYSDHGGFFAGHSDGSIEIASIRHIFECKSANKKRFDQFVKDGVLKTSPTYFGQAQCYMRYSGLDCCLFAIYCKDDSNLHFETIYYDEEYAGDLVAKAGRIIQTHAPDGKIHVPVGISEKPDCLECQWCRFKTTCHSPKEAIQTTQSCRSCAYLVIGPDYIPHCGRHNRQLKNINICCPNWSWVWRAPF